ncbi:MAG: protein translocase subunit SecF [Thermodesulfobacteriota bacterium]|nr:protein translocase subunit SecF [Thermodesulfobacteriota bacterium]
MIQIVKPGINIDFIGKKRLALLFSSILILLSIGSIALKGGLNYGIDFAGGTMVQIWFKKGATPDEVRKGLQKIGLEGSTIQQFGKKTDNEYLIRTENTQSDIEGVSDKIQDVFREIYGEEGIDVRRVEMVGPQVGKELRKKGLLAVIYAMVGILIYITWRFEFRFALGALAALLHDVIITVGIFSITNKEFNLAILAAILTIVGYSLNDTIVVYDRIRENLKKLLKKKLEPIINTSINETLSRTILTSGTTLFVVVALFFLGGGVIHDFAFVLIVGIIIGTYSSIFVASPLLILWEEKFPSIKKKRL